MLDISMVILYFLGGEDIVKRDSREINKKHSLMLVELH